jgi:CRP/FNR family transcriptional regulator
MYAATAGSPPRALNGCIHCELRPLRQFCNLDSSALNDFDSLGVTTSLQSGAKLFEEQTQSSGIFVLCSGRVKLSCTSKQGKTLILRIALPGDVLGLGAVMSGARYEVTAETIEPCRLKIIKRDAFMPFLQKHAEASVHAAQSLSRDYMSAFIDVRRLALSDTAAGRLAGILLDWGRAASRGKDQMRFTMGLTHEELANLSGISRETVTRMLSRFKREKLIQVRGATVVILSPERLEQLAA